MTRLVARLWAVAAKWSDAKADQENGQLTYGIWGSPDRHHVEHSWWLLPEAWGLGLEVSRVDWLPGGYDGNVMFAIVLGPLSWSLLLHQPSRSAVRR